MKIFVINPGSTSTKVALFDGTQCLWTETQRYDTAELESFASVAEQEGFRYDRIARILKDKGVEPSSFAAVVGRGGLLKPIPGGTYRVGSRMLEDLKSMAYGSHASNLGAALAVRFAAAAGDVPAFIVDPVVVDELADEAEDILDTRVALGAVSPYAVLLESGDPARLPSIRDGRAGAQDEGSQLAALIAASAPLEGGSDKRWLDLCAGPGGKAALLAGLASSVGARVTANEVHPHRARLVERTTRQFDSIEVVSGDGRSFGGGRSAWPLASFDRVVVDAPCSGMGSMRRRPESRWNRTPADVEELTVLQRELLDRALALTRPGGVLTYITCSPHATETRDQVARLLDGGKVELLDTVALAHECAPEALDVPASAGIIKGYDGRTLQLWDHRFGTDLMFVACLRRR